MALALFFDKSRLVVISQHHHASASDPFYFGNITLPSLRRRPLHRQRLQPHSTTKKAEKSTPDAQANSVSCSNSVAYQQSYRLAYDGGFR
jgi:hypothetical protein